MRKSFLIPSILIVLFLKGSLAWSDTKCLSIFSETKHFALQYLEQGYAPEKKILREKQDLRIAAWNMKDFYVRSVGRGGAKVRQKKPNPHVRSKSKAKIKATLNTINNINPDILVAIEVFGGRSTEVLDPNNRYNRIPSENIDGRGSYIEFLVAKHLFVDVELHLPNAKTENIALDRGLPTILIRQKDEAGRVDRGKAPDLIVMGVHLLSQARLRGEELNTVKKDEAKLIIDGVKELEALYPDAPIIITGDFNLHLPARFAIDDLRSIFVKSLANLLPEAKPEDSTFSLIRTNKKNKSNFIGAYTLDSIALNQSAARLFINSAPYVFRGPNWQSKKYFDEDGTVSSIPLSRDDVVSNPSDHRPIVSDYNLKK